MAKLYRKIAVISPATVLVLCLTGHIVYCETDRILLCPGIDNYHYIPRAQGNQGPVLCCVFLFPVLLRLVTLAKVFRKIAIISPATVSVL